MTRAATPRVAALAALAVIGAIAWSRTASAGVIPPGREPVVQELVSAAVRASGSTAPTEIAIDREVIRLRFDDDAGPSPEMTVHEPGSDAGSDALADGVTLACTAECTEAERARFRGLARALSVERARVARGIL